MSDLCFYCRGPKPCDCWKGGMTPSRREEVQLMELAKYFAKRDQDMFDQRQATRATVEKAVRGEFGNQKAAGPHRRTA